jgi:hypothetical protein
MRICGVTRQGILQAVKANKLRLRSRKRPPRAFHLLPLEDLMTWQASRRGGRMPGDWATYVQNLVRLQERTLVRCGDVVSCQNSGAAADVNETKSEPNLATI